VRQWNVEFSLRHAESVEGYDCAPTAALNVQISNRSPFKAREHFTRNAEPLSNRVEETGLWKTAGMQQIADSLLVFRHT